jgi:hypothetical protein
VTIPVVLLEPDIESPAVTTLTGDYRQAQSAVTAEVLLTVGGRVLAGTPGEAVRGAWVQIVGLNPPAVQVVNRRLITGTDGRFLFSRLRQGRYRIRAIAAGIGDVPREVDVPSETGEYDVQFS